MALYSSALVELNEKDVPGASLAFNDIQCHTNIQLKRWLSRRGLSTAGRKQDLIERVESCIQAGQQNKLDPSIDGGKWQEAKQQLQKQKDQQQQQSQQSPLLPIVGWKNFPSKNIPSTFNYGNIYHYIVESVQNMPSVQDVEDCDTNCDDNRDRVDLHTAKPLRKGKTFFTSGHVQNMKDNENTDFYFVKCTVQASLAPSTYYNVSCTMSKSSGYIADASCTCKASRMGRCNHVSGLLYAVLDYTEKFGTDAVSCTSKQCSWNKGRTTKKVPKKIQEAKYNSYKSKKSDDIHLFDPRPVSHRNSQNPFHINSFISKLQTASAASFPNSSSMFETILQLSYHDYSLSDVEKEVLEIKCMQLVQNLYPTVKSPYPTQIVEDQQSPQWYIERRVRITASVAHRILHLQSLQSITNYLYEHLWSAQVINSRAMSHGIENEARALDQYYREAKEIEGGFAVSKTGLWTSSGSPELACSPDALVKDPSLGEQNMYGLAEVKCPYSLREHHIKDYEKVLSGKQLMSFCLEQGENGPQLKKSHPYYSQVQMQMGVMGTKWCDFVVWGEKGYIVDRVQFDPCLWAEMKTKLERFHHSKLCPEYFEMKTVRKLSHVIS